MSSLNSKRSGGVSKYRGFNNASGSKNQPHFGGKKNDGYPLVKIVKPVKKKQA